MAIKKKKKIHIPSIIRMLRPAQWVKNGFVFAPLVFALEFGQSHSWLLAVVAFLSFVCASSIVYIFNDIKDLASDRHHPEKRFRPLAAKRVTVSEAIFVAAFLFGVMIGMVFILPYQTWVVLALYITQNILYSLWLKKIAILDVLVIALGFVLRVLMGGYAISVEVSPYLIIATFMLSLFLGFAKRYHELRRLNQPESAVLGAYNINLLDRMISVSCGAALMTYALYTVEIAKRMGELTMVYTLAFVVFGLFRYLQYVYYSKKGGAPEKILYSDPLFIGNIVAWLITVILVLLQII